MVAKFLLYKIEQDPITTSALDYVNKIYALRSGNGK